VGYVDEDEQPAAAAAEPQNPNSTETLRTYVPVTSALQVGYVDEDEQPTAAAAGDGSKAAGSGGRGKRSSRGGAAAAAGGGSSKRPKKGLGFKG
jgi:hypothetical protein